MEFHKTLKFPLQFSKSLWSLELFAISILKIYLFAVTIVKDAYSLDKIEGLIPFVPLELLLNSFNEIHSRLSNGLANLE
jgi:hypothetical protein